MEYGDPGKNQQDREQIARGDALIDWTTGWSLISDDLTVSGCEQWRRLRTRPIHLRRSHGATGQGDGDEGTTLQTREACRALNTYCFIPTLFPLTIRRVSGRSWLNHPIRLFLKGAEASSGGAVPRKPRLTAGCQWGQQLWHCLTLLFLDIPPPGPGRTRHKPAPLTLKDKRKGSPLPSALTT